MKLETIVIVGCAAYMVWIVAQAFIVLIISKLPVRNWPSAKKAKLKYRFKKP